MALSDEYKMTLQEMHRKQHPMKKWGTTGARAIGPQMVHILQSYNGWIKTILDFGAGQGGLFFFLKRMLPQDLVKKMKWEMYDPGIPGIQKFPEGKFDMVCSSDVLEHVEPEMVDKTIHEIFELADKAIYLLVACAECKLILPDGRNAHLTVHEPDWWRERIETIGQQHGQWETVYYASVWKRKRTGLKPHMEIHLERRGS